MAYVLSGGKWSRPVCVTFSFMPDGTDTPFGIPSDLQAKWSSLSGWQDQVRIALAKWEDKAEINFAEVGDDGSVYGTDLTQGDPEFGDIRFGGCDFGDASAAAFSMGSPGDSYISKGPIVGDVFFNTNAGCPWKVDGINFPDIQTVAIHEVGHSLGLDHVTNPVDVMCSNASRIARDLQPDDIAGIRAIYGTRVPDAYYPCNTVARAISLDGDLDDKLQASTSVPRKVAYTDMHFFKATVPQGTNGIMTARVQSVGLSCFMPTLNVFDLSHNLLATVKGMRCGDTISHTRLVSPGSVFYLRVMAANPYWGGAGRFGVLVNFGGYPLSPIPADIEAIP